MPAPQSPQLAVLVVLSAIAILPLNMFVPSLPSIAQDLHADAALVNVAVAGYAIATAVAHLIAGALSDRYGRRPVALIALAVFTLASVGCSLANDIATFLLCRLVQASVVAAYAVSLAVIRDTSDERTTASRIGYVTSAWAVAPMVGPALGGLLEGHFGWRANFVVFAVLGLAGLVLAALRLPETNHHRSASLALALQLSGLAAAVTVMGAGIVAFLSGLVVHAENAHLSVLSAMQLSSALSLLAVLFIVRAEGKR